MREGIPSAAAAAVWEIVVVVDHEAQPKLKQDESDELWMDGAT